MHGPEAAGWLLVALCAGIGGYCLRWCTRWARSGPPWWRQVTAVEGAMGLGMAAMALPAGLAAGPAAAWAAFFAAMAVWCLLLCRARVPHGAHHALEAAAMAYMALAMAVTPPAHASHAPAGVPWLTGLLLAYFAGHALRTGRALVPAVPAVPGHGRAARGPQLPAPGVGRARPPEVAAACRLALSVATVTMLATL